MEERLERVLNTIIFFNKINIRDLAVRCGYNLKAEKNNHDCCVTLRHDIEKINKSSEHPFTIVYDKDYNYWVARNEEEREEFEFKKKLMPAIKKLQSYWVSKKKAQCNGQYTFNPDDEEFKTFIYRAFRG